MSSPIHPSAGQSPAQSADGSLPATPHRASSTGTRNPFSESGGPEGVDLAAIEGSPRTPPFASGADSSPRYSLRGGPTNDARAPDHWLNRSSGGFLRQAEAGAETGEDFSLHGGQPAAPHAGVEPARPAPRLGVANLVPAGSQLPLLIIPEFDPSGTSPTVQGTPGRAEDASLTDLLIEGLPLRLPLNDKAKALDKLLDHLSWTPNMPWHVEYENAQGDQLPGEDAGALSRQALDAALTQLVQAHSSLFQFENGYLIPPCLQDMSLDASDKFDFTQLQTCFEFGLLASAAFEKSVGAKVQLSESFMLQVQDTFQKLAVAAPSIKDFARAPAALENFINTLADTQSEQLRAALIAVEHQMKNMNLDVQDIRSYSQSKLSPLLAIGLGFTFSENGKFNLSSKTVTQLTQGISGLPNLPEQLKKVLDYKNLHELSDDCVNQLKSNMTAFIDNSSLETLQAFTQFCTGAPNIAPPGKLEVFLKPKDGMVENRYIVAHACMKQVDVSDEFANLAPKEFKEWMEISLINSDVFNAQ